MRSDNEFEGLLKSALTQKAEPDAGIQREVLAQWTEHQNTDKKKWSVAVAAAACVLMTTVSVGATTLILNSRNTAPEPTEMTESTESQGIFTDEYTTYIRSGAWKDDIADAELVFTSEKLEKNSSGAYEFTCLEESDGASTQIGNCFYDRDFIDNLAVTKNEYSYTPSAGDFRLITVARKAADGTVQVEVYKKYEK
jgi:hypothetical protein